MTDLRTLILKCLEISPLDIFTLSKGLNVDILKLAGERAAMLEAGSLGR